MLDIHIETLFNIADSCLIITSQFFPVLGLEAAKPQLRSIYRVLNDLFMRQTAQGSQSPLGTAQDIRVVQYLSPACRASHHPIARHLTASSALLTLDDYDLFKCKNGFYAPSNFLSTAFSEIILETILPSILSGFILVNVVLYNVSVLVLILPYLTFFVFFMWLFLIYNPSHRRIQKLGRRSQNQRRVGKMIVMCFLTDCVHVILQGT